MLLRCQKPHARKTPHIPLFQDGAIWAVVIAAITERFDHLFRITVGRDNDGNVHVPGGPRSGADRNGDPSDDGPAQTESPEIRIDPVQGAFEAVHFGDPRSGADA